MIEIKNVSNEPYEVVTRIDPSAPGCRIAPPGPLPLVIDPGECVSLLGYEPGSSFIIRPVERPDEPRSLFGVS